MNKTKFKTLDRFNGDNRVKNIYQDEDGIWVDLNSGWGFEGCISLRGNTCSDIIEDMKDVEPYNWQ